MDRKQAAYYVLFQPKSNNCAAVVSYMAGYFKKAKQYYTSIKDLAIGDIVFFQNSKGLSHVGLCVSWSDAKKTFTTIEGNKGDKVAYGTYSYSDVGGYVAGFGKPRYTDEITRKAVIDYAISQVGYTEGANNWNKYADELDKVDYFVGCGKKQNLPWCAVFICACVYNAYNSEPTPPTPPEPPKPTDTYKVKTSGNALRIRLEPNTKCTQAGYINNGTTITALDVVKGEDVEGVNAWVKTKDGRFYGSYTEGYISGKYLTPTPEVQPTPEPTIKKYKVVTASGDSLRTRQEPTTDSKQVGFILNGSIIEVSKIVEGEDIDGVNTWALTDYGTHYDGATSGYCSTKYLKEV